MDNGLRRLEVERELRRHAPEIREETLDLLVEMYSATRLYGTECEFPIDLDERAGIRIPQGAQINKIVRANNIRTSLEIGFAYGFSTVWIMDALSDEGIHRAVDPFEKSVWGGIGLKQIERLRNAKRKFIWMEDYSIHALAEMIKQKMEFDFIFIDGNHRFDDVLVDFYLADQVLKSEGIISFDDLWMPSVRTVVSFILSNREYELIRQPVKRMTVLKKKAQDVRPWDHFKRFKIHKEALRNI